MLVLKLKKSEITLYIPHGSDETRRNGNGANVNIFLYIPHGSDETCNCIAQESCPLCFISHMVQMKLMHLCCCHSMQRTLYPTWFR